MAAAKSRSTRSTGRRATAAKPKAAAKKAAPKKAAAPKRKAAAKPAAKKAAAKVAAPKKAAPKKKAAAKPAARKKQAATALKKAQSVRTRRSRVRKQIESGKKNPADVLRSLPAALNTLPVQDFLTWIPGVGSENSKKITRGVVLNPSIELQTLGSHTIERLATRIERRAPGERAESLRAA